MCCKIVHSSLSKTSTLDILSRSIVLKSIASVRRDFLICKCDVSPTRKFYLYCFLLTDKFLDMKHSQMIQMNYATLVENLDVECGNLLDRLYGFRALTRREIATINTKPTKHEKSEILLDLASKFSPANFKQFLQALKESSQEHVVSIITGNHCKYAAEVFHFPFACDDNVYLD